MKKQAEKKQTEKKQRTKFHEFTAENDIRYKAPLNYQHFQMLGWACIVCAVGSIVIGIGGKMNAGVLEQYGKMNSVLSFIAQFSLPLLLLASFSRLLNNEEGYKKMLLVNGGAALGIFAFTMIFGSRYFIGVLEKMVVQKEQVVPLVNATVYSLIPGGFVAFNMFVDLFMCTLIMFFLNVRPKRFFTGKKLLILRFMVLLPIGYEIYCFWLKLQSIRGNVILPLWSFPLLTMKPPMMILLFVVMAFVVKIREYRYCKHGNTHEEYLAFMKTNRNSFHLSVRLAILMVVFAVVDLILLVVLTYMNANDFGALTATGEMVEGTEDTLISLSLAVGIGKSWSIMLLAPFMLLFSYNNVPKKKVISLFLPVIAIALSIIVVLEATRMGVGMLMEGHQLDIDAIAEVFAGL